MPLKCPHCGKSIPEDVVIEHMRERSRETGRLGGRKTAKRGAEFFRKIQAKRKTFSGGRPPKQGNKESK